MKMVFWESTHIGFVAYPNWLSNIYDNQFFARSLTICIGLATLGGLIFSLLFLIKRVPKMFLSSSAPDEAALFIFFSLLLVLPFCGLYAVLFIIKRYLFPLVPLYMILIALALQSFLYSQTKPGKLP